MSVDHLWSCLHAATQEESSDPMQWEKVVSQIQTAFREGHLVEECTCKTVILILKGNGDFQGIGLV